MSACAVVFLQRGEGRGGEGDGEGGGEGLFSELGEKESRTQPEGGIGLYGHCILREKRHFEVKLFMQ